MAIYRPGQRYRYHNLLKRKSGKRSTTVVLSLTAMVDMFTVLVIFLLQNYNVTGEILHMPKDIVLPIASRVNELSPAIVVTVTPTQILVDNENVASVKDVASHNGLTIKSIEQKVRQIISKNKAESESIANIAKKADENGEIRVTVQADKAIDYIIIKKVMYSVHLGGAQQINFAVAKEAKL